MVWDYMDGSTYPPPPPPPPPVVTWTKGDTPPVNNPGGPVLNSGQSSNVQPPAVPKQTGNSSGKTSVDTPSLDVFASNMGKLIAPVKDAWTTLNGVAPIAAGSFADATTIRSRIAPGTGDSGGSSTTSGQDLKSSYLSVLQDLYTGLGDLQTAAQQMSTKYKTTDDLNGASATDLQNDFADAGSQFGQMMTDNGGAPISTTSTTL